MGKSTISMAIFNSKVLVYQRVNIFSSAPTCAKAEEAVAMPCSVALCSWLDADWNAYVATGRRWETALYVPLVEAPVIRMLEVDL